MIKISKIRHCEQDRLKLDFPYSNEILNKIRKLKKCDMEQNA